MTARQIAVLDALAAEHPIPLTGNELAVRLGVRDYHLSAGENVRIRIPLQSGGRDKRVVLNWQQDQSGWSGGYYNLTLRR